VNVKVGLVWDAVGPVASGRGLLDFARGAGLDAFLVFDHLIETVAWLGAELRAASAEPAVTS
jgi:hypothetical protein